MVGRSASGAPLLKAHGASLSSRPSSHKPRIGSAQAARLKELRDEEIARQFNTCADQEAAQRKEQRELRFHARWHHVRAFYAAVTERIAERQRTTWLRALSMELHRALVLPSTTSSQLESAMHTVLHSSLPPAAWEEVIVLLHNVFYFFQRGDAPTVDYREMLCACLVLDRCQYSETRMLSLWVDEYSTPFDTSGQMGVQVADLRRLVLTPCSGVADESKIVPFIGAISARSTAPTPGWVRDVDIIHFAESRPELVTQLKELCWCRLIDDMRLGFYRDLYRQAMERVDSEEHRCRVQAAVQLWRLREPRVRFARWKAFVVERLLRHRSDAHYRAASGHKLLCALLKNRQRSNELRRSMQSASATHQKSLLKWVIPAWRLFTSSTALMYDREISTTEVFSCSTIRVTCYRHQRHCRHRAAWHRSVHRYELRLLTRVWQAYFRFVVAARVQQALRQSRVDAFVSHRHRKMVHISWSVWVYVYRRRKEVRVAEQYEWQLHRSIQDLALLAQETAQMAVEDTISRAVRQKEQELEEVARRRAFQEATERVNVQRKLRQQREERTRVKREHDERVVAEMEEAWVRIEHNVAAEVRISTLAWCDTPEGKREVHDEAVRIFERDPVETQKTLLQDPHAFALPGCRWQLQLEDYGGRFAKAFYLNLETLEKFACDQLVMENCEVIAREVIIQHKIDESRSRLKVKAAGVAQERRENEAARKIQMLFLCRHALLVVRNRIRFCFIKRVEASTGDIVYFNVTRQETRRRPPRLIGSDEPTIPQESTTWVRRIDDDGNNYYIRMDTGETSWTPPPHYLLCSSCRANFATRRWNEAGARFCIVCFAEGQKKGFFGATATWTKLSVQPAKCVVCRHGSADVLCHECCGDVTCRTCCHALHRDPKLAMHSNQDWLVYA